MYEHTAIAGGFVGELHEPGVADDLVGTAVKTLGHVDVLVNNAGGGVIRPTLEHTEESLRATIDNNLWTTIYCVRAVLPHMVSRGHGRIINIGADSVRTGLMDHAMYNAAKGGVHAMVTGLAREFGDGRDHGEHRGAVLRPHTRVREVVQSGEAPPRLERVVKEGTAIVPLGRPATRRRSRQPSPFSPAKTADSSPDKRSTSTAAAAWADAPSPQPRGTMTLTTTALRDAADRLIAAAAAPRQCDPVRDILGDNDIGSAYSVQRMLTESSLTRGRRIVGHEIG